MGEVNLEGLESIFASSGRTVILPVDHDYDISAGSSSVTNVSEHLLAGRICGVNAVLAHEDVIVDNRSIINGTDARLNTMGIIQQINAGIPHSAARQMTRTVEQAYDNGADMFGVHFNFGSEEELQTLQDVEDQAKACERLGLPWKMFAHVYIRRWENGEVYNYSDTSNEEYGQLISGAIKRVISLGARVVKVAFREEETFQLAVDTSHKERVPIVMAGGKMVSMEDFLRTASTAIHVNKADGLATGTNAWGRPMDTDRPPLDLSLYGPVPSDYKIVGMSDRYLLPDDEVTALIALSAIVHGNAHNTTEALSAVYRAISMPDDALRSRELS